MKINESKKLISILGIISGLIIIFVGLTRFNASYASSAEKQSYGGDAYTGIQQAIAQDTKNTSYIDEHLLLFCKTMVIITGVLVVLHYATNLSECKYIANIEKEE